MEIFSNVFNLFPNTIKSYFDETRDESVILPSSNYRTKQVEQQLQSQNDYNYLQAESPNIKNYVSNFYDRNNIYNKNNQNSSFTTNSKLIPTKISGLTGKPMEMSHSNMVPSFKNSKSFQLLPDTFSDRKFEYLSGNSVNYQPKKEVEWGKFHDTTPQNANHNTLNKIEDEYQRAKDNLNIFTEGTNLLPSPKISVSAPKPDTIRIVPRTSDIINSAKPLLSGFKGIFLNGGSDVSGLPFQRSKTTSKIKKTFDSNRTDIDLDVLLGGKYWKPQETKVSLKNKEIKSELLNGKSNIGGSFTNTKNTKFSKKKNYSYSGNPGVSNANFIKRDLFQSKQKKEQIVTGRVGNSSSNGNFNRNNLFKQSGKETGTYSRSIINDSNNTAMPKQIYESKKTEQNNRINIGGIDNTMSIQTPQIFGRSKEREFKRTTEINNKVSDLFNRNVFKN